MSTFEKSNPYIDSDLIIESLHSMIHENKEGYWTHEEVSNTLFRVLYVYEGEYCAYLDKKQIIVKENDILFIPKGISYSSKSISNIFSYVCIYFYALPNDIKDSFFNKIILLENTQKLKSKFQKVYDDHTAKSFGFKISVKKQLYDILESILYEKIFENHIDVSYYAIKKAVRYIEKNYIGENITVDYLAQLCNITPTYFINLFKKTYKTTPKNYIIRLKIDKAKELLKYSNSPISKITDLLGYSDSAYFSAAFKKSVGVSPHHYRKNY